jgi:hypothetical protein
MYHSDLKLIGLADEEMRTRELSNNKQFFISFRQMRAWAVPKCRRQCDCEKSSDSREVSRSIFRGRVVGNGAMMSDMACSQQLTLKDRDAQRTMNNRR